MKTLALWLVVVCLAVHYGYGFFDDKVMAEVWNMTGSLGRLVLLGLVALAYRSRWVWLVCWWWAVEEMQVIGCGMAWLVKPWPLLPGEGRCSAMVGVPLGLVGLGVALSIVWTITRSKVQT